MPAPAIELRGITKRYPGVVANRDVNLRVESGTAHAVIGENGAGKSTLMNILYGMVVPDGVLRGFRNVAETEALLLTILGAHDAGHCIWAESLQPAFADAADSRPPPQ